LGVQVYAVEVDAETDDVEIIRSAAVGGGQCRALYQSADLASLTHGWIAQGVSQALLERASEYRREG
jgi:hypothetical protein